MSAKVIKMLEFLTRNSPAHQAYIRALNRPMAVPLDGNLSDEYFANWLIEGLAIEGFKTVPIDEKDR
jgi:hypothetical protein